VATDLAPRTDGADVVTTPRAVHRRRGALLVAAALFNVWVWGTRMRNLLADADSFSSAFVGVHVVLYVAATVVALVVGGIGVRQWREARAAARPEA
jgi:hypothetical protein